MVAAAPKEGALKLPIAAALLVSFLAVLALVVWLTKYTAVYRLTSLEQSPEVLRAPPATSSRNSATRNPHSTVPKVCSEEDYLAYITTNDQSANRWERLRTEGPGAYRFWYRESPRYFETLEDISFNAPGLMSPA